VVLGRAELEVVPGPGGRSRVRWREELRVRGLPSAIDPLLHRAALTLFGRVVNRLLRTP